MRIASFVPAATEALAALGVRRQLVGVSHSCGGVADLAGLDLRVLTRCRVPSGGSSGAIDGAVKTAAANRADVQVFDPAALAAVRPDLVVLPAEKPGGRTPCTVDPVALRRLVAGFEPMPRLIEYGPVTFTELHGSVRALGEAVGKGAEAARLVAELRGRIDRVREMAGSSARRPRVALLSWVNPPVVAGGLLAECVTLAGGQPLLAAASSPARAVEWDALVSGRPDVLLVAPCDFTLERAVDEAAALRRVEELRATPAARWGQVHALDGRRWLSAPGPGLVRGLEMLACLILPELPWPDGQLPRAAWRPLDLD